MAEGFSDEVIKNLIDLTRGAEILSKVLGCSVSRAMEIQLQTMKVMNDIREGQSTPQDSLLDLLMKAKTEGKQ